MQHRPGRPHPASARSPAPEARAAPAGSCGSSPCASQPLPSTGAEAVQGLTPACPLPPAERRLVVALQRLQRARSGRGSTPSSLNGAWRWAAPVVHHGPRHRSA